MVATRKVRTVMVGGCAYRRQLSAEHAISVTHFANLCATTIDKDAPVFVGQSYLHTSNLWQGRCLWLESVMEDPQVSTALTVDADTAFDAPEMLRALAGMNASLAIAPVREAPGGSNLRVLNGNELRALEDTEHLKASRARYEIECGGLAVAAFDLDWMREHMPRPRPELLCWGAEYKGRKLSWLGEDMAIGLTVRMHGGKVESLPVRTSHFAYRGESL